MKENGSGGGRRSYQGKNQNSVAGNTPRQQSTRRQSAPQQSARQQDARRQEPQAGGRGRRVIHDAAAQKVHHRRKTLLIVLLCLVILAGAGVAAFKIIVRAPDIPVNKPAQGGITGTGGTSTVTDAPEAPIQIGGDGTVARTDDHHYTFLVCGTDVVADNTDTIMVVSYDVDQQTVNVVSVPRDTLINVSWGTKKINAAYPSGGVDQLKSELTKLLGFTVDYYVFFDKAAVVEFVNTIGGVDFEVPRNMVYDDPDQNLHINIGAGWQHLDGDSAYKVLRYRQGNNGTGYADGDIGRINTQQSLLKAIMKQTLQITNLTKINSFAQLFVDYVQTDLALGEIAWLAQQALGLDMANVQFMTIPGNYNDSVKGQSYVTVYVNELLEMVNTCLNPYDTAVTISNLDVLTRDSNGNLYATTGNFRGGYDSFTDYRSGGGSSTVTPTEPTEPTEPVTPAETTDPAEGGETTEPTEPTEPSEGETGGETTDPAEGGEPADPAGGAEPTDPAAGGEIVVDPTPSTGTEGDSTGSDAALVTK